MLTESGLTLITGTMFSGKSTELIRRLNRLEAADYLIQLFKPQIDMRYNVDYVTSHDGFKKRVTYINSVDDIYKNFKSKTQVIGIDEIQFLESKVIQFCNQEAKNCIIIAAGLLKNFQDNYFPFKDKKLDMSDLLRVADNVIHLNAICTYEKDDKRCTKDATRIQRFKDGKIVPYDDPLVQVGGKEAYEPRCRDHFVPYQEVLDKLKVD
jgi:thymidine kinase